MLDIITTILYFYLMNYVWCELWQEVVLTILTKQMNFTSWVCYRLIVSWQILFLKNLWIS